MKARFREPRAAAPAAKPAAPPAKRAEAPTAAKG
jgi:hypothetical protein